MDHDNPLAAYFKSHPDLTQGDFARLVGVDSPLVSMWISGARYPNLENAFAIERATGGDVPAKAWVGITKRSAAAVEKPKRTRKAV